MFRRMSFLPALAVAILFSALLSSPAHAYIGPGMTGGAIAAVLGVIGSLFLGLFAVIYYPIKRRLRARKHQQAGALAAPEGAPQAGQNEPSVSPQPDKS